MTPCPDGDIANSACHCHFCVSSMDSTDLRLEAPCYPNPGYRVNAHYRALFLDLITYMSSSTSNLLHIFHIMFHAPLRQKIENDPLYPRANTQYEINKYVLTHTLSSQGSSTSHSGEGQCQKMIPRRHTLLYKEFTHLIKDKN